MSKDQHIQKNIFEAGTVLNFVGIFFLLLMPALMQFFHFYIDYLWYKIPGVLALSTTLIFYVISPNCFTGQLKIIGLNFLLFGLLQIFTKYSEVSGEILIFIGVVLIITGFALNKGSID